VTKILDVEGKISTNNLLEVKGVRNGKVPAGWTQEDSPGGETQNKDKKKNVSRKVKG